MVCNKPRTLLILTSPLPHPNVQLRSRQINFFSSTHPWNFTLFGHISGFQLRYTPSNVDNTSDHDMTKSPAKLDHQAESIQCPHTRFWRITIVASTFPRVKNCHERSLHAFYYIYMTLRFRLINKQLNGYR